MADQIRIEDVRTEEQARLWWVQQWRRPEFVAERIEDLQIQIMHILIWNPSGAPLVPGYCMKNESVPFLPLFRRLRPDCDTPFKLLRAIDGLSSVTDCEIMLLWDLWRSNYYRRASERLWRRHLIIAVERIRKIFSWQYSQEKAKKKAAR